MEDIQKLHEDRSSEREEETEQKKIVGSAQGSVFDAGWAQIGRPTVSPDSREHDSH